MIFTKIYYKNIKTPQQSCFIATITNNAFATLVVFFIFFGSKGNLTADELDKALSSCFASYNMPHCTPLSALKPHTSITEETDSVYRHIRAAEESLRLTPSTRQIARQNFNIVLELGTGVSEELSQILNNSVHVWEQIIANHKRVHGFASLYVEVRNHRLNNKYSNQGGTYGDAFIFSCHENTPAAYKGRLRFDEELFATANASKDYKFATVLHEIGHLLMPLNERSRFYKINQDGSKTPIRKPEDCITRKYYRKNTQGQEFFIGKKTISYFNELAAKKGWGVNFFKNGIPLSGGHPSGNAIDYLALAPGIFGNPTMPYIEEYLLYMLEDTGYTINWDATKRFLPPTNLTEELWQLICTKASWVLRNAKSCLSQESVWRSWENCLELSVRSCKKLFEQQHNKRCTEAQLF